MPCTDPRTVGFLADGKTLTWSQKQYSKEFATFQLPCSQCLECRLSQAREKAIRCIHEAAEYEHNSFITLTYSDEHLKSPKLIYEDWQKFAKRLRENAIDPKTGIQPRIPIMVTGEYGEKNKRPHWHAIVFNWAPPQEIRKAGLLLPDTYHETKTERGDILRSSHTLDTLWARGKADYGAVTLESAGYVARYATKKLVHGKDGHGYEPIHKMSSKYAIGKAWLERHWPDVFLQGHIILKDGTKAPIPRYYERWLKDNKPHEWLAYVTRIKLDRIQYLEQKEKSDEQKWWDVYNKRRLTSKTPLRRNEVRRLIKEKQFEQLQAYLKL